MGAVAVAHERTRWRMSVEARGLVLVTAVLMAFGLVVLYSSSAVLAIQEGHSSAHYLIRQLIGAAAGCVVFAVAAKMDAEKWRTWAWPLMGLSVLLLLVLIRPFTGAIAPRINGSRRWLTLGEIIAVIAVASMIASGSPCASPNIMTTPWCESYAVPWLPGITLTT